MYGRNGNLAQMKLALTLLLALCVGFMASTYLPKVETHPPIDLPDYRTHAQLCIRPPYGETNSFDVSLAGHPIKHLK